MAGRALTPATRLRLGGPLPRQLPDRSIAAPKAPKLCSLEIMGYYAQFPMPIPHLGARSIPLLTLPPLDLAIPFDLHVLAMPPAFNLSQDQTLHLIFLAGPLRNRLASRKRRPVAPQSVARSRRVAQAYGLSAFDLRRPDGLNPDEKFYSQLSTFIHAPVGHG